MSGWRLIVLVALVASVLARGAVAQPATDGYTIHVVQRGENLFRIALGYGLTADELAAINGITNPASIQVGQRLLVPLSAAGGATPDLAIHTIEPGDTLDAIAGLYAVPLDALLGANPDVDPANLIVGKLVIIPQGATSSEALPSEGEVPPPETLPPPSGTVIHTVQPGETLFRIATQYGLTVNELAAANTITDPTRIFVGQQLVLPGLVPPQLASNLPTPLTSLHLNPQILVEGRTGYIEVRAEAGLTIAGTFLNQTLQGVEITDGVYRLFVGIPVFTEPGVYPLALQVTPAESTDPIPISANIQVIQGPYGNESIQLIEGRDTLLNTNVEDAEATLINRVISPFTAERYLQGKMSLPAAAAITSGFGTRRSYNGGAFDRYHSGTDFAGVPGTPILAPAPGRVVMADTLNIRGNATILEHGWGIYTGYWHQTEIYVGLGDIVETGQVIGTIGSTGRVTGAHLHWELWVNGVPVDPMQWVQQPFVTLE